MRSFCNLLQASPEFKGIKTSVAATFAASFWLQASPEFKGIKTTTLHGLPALKRLQASPEFKGIKTEVANVVRVVIHASSQP